MPVALLACTGRLASACGTSLTFLGQYLGEDLGGLLGLWRVRLLRMMIRQLGGLYPLLLPSGEVN